MFGLLSKFSKKEAIIGLDIGSHSIKLACLNMEGPTPKLLHVASAALQGDLFSSNAIKDTERVAEQISALFDSSGIDTTKVALAVPGPSVFIKKIQVPKQSTDELKESIQYEAGSYIPHALDDVKLDYHVAGEASKTLLDVTLVAVKNEIIDSFTETAALAGLEPMVVDVDYFAMQNIFELCYPEFVDETVVLIHIGERFSAVNICRAGASLFCGDVSIGGNTLSEMLSQELGISLDQAQSMKVEQNSTDPNFEKFNEVVDQYNENSASEFQRQLSFFWNATGEDSGIDRVMVFGGGSIVPGFLEELSAKTGLQCEKLDSLRGIEISEGIDPETLKVLSPSLGVALGLALRYPGDRIARDFE